ncbi:hypothetical protein [Zestomonas carbonaria]|uniref:Uncharacterized protein n=1 Tax=Zestomonas carbonaria TaxID=2762745 RepID=A0A7U7EMW9_9GAMM|nr:hypothetical protein [Pseudomonas carbonaria]CAD5107988.1 hypothetical protein PSEWESI4_02271 [Pseudomonas carbonaria]
MLWRTTNKPSTRDLVRGDHRLQSIRRRRLWPWLLLVCLVVAPFYLWIEERQDLSRQLAALREENRDLEARLQRSELLQREAQATERQLVRRNADLSAQVERLSTELAFFRQQKDNH